MTTKHKPHSSLHPTPVLETTIGQKSFAELFADAIPLRHNKKVVLPPKKTPKPPTVKRVASQNDHPRVDYVSADCIDTLEPEPSYIKANGDKSLLRKLRRGFWPIADQVDIHGYDRFEAQRELHHFFATTQATCVLVIHGRALNASKGPILKKVARTWLAAQPFVLAYCEAPVNKGGEGAVVVLLKSRGYKQYH